MLIFGKLLQKRFFSKICNDDDGDGGKLTVSCLLSAYLLNQKLSYYVSIVQSL